MGDIKIVAPVALFCGVIGSDSVLMDTAAEKLCTNYGSIDIISELIPFDGSDYYADEMGDTLFRRFYSFTDLIKPDLIVGVKLATQNIEDEYSVELGGKMRRRVNLDPGYIAPSRLVLATTKDFSHRIYLKDGIYAEVTLGFSKQGCRYFDWTYPDFKNERYQKFFFRVRRTLLATQHSFASVD
jgi:hypothetical protein